MRSQIHSTDSKVRLLRAHRISNSYANECRALQEKIRQERGGELMPDSTDVIREMRNSDLR